MSAAAAVVAIVIVISSSLRGMAAPQPVTGPLPTTTTSSSTTGTRPTTVASSAATSVSKARTAGSVSTAIVLAAFRAQDLATPVTTTPLPDSGMEWHLQPGKLTVAWRSEASYTSRGPTNQPDDSRGYVITTAQVEPLVGQDSGLPVATSSAPASVNGRAARLITAPKGAVDDQGYPAQYRLSWQLPDGRWIHVFDTDLDTKTTSLQQFAESLRNGPTPSVRAIYFTQAPKGYRIVAGHFGFFNQSLSLCATPTETDLTKCFTFSSGDGDGALASSSSIVPNGDSHAVRNGTLYLELAKNQAQIFLDKPASGSVVLQSPVPLTAAQFSTIATSISVTA